MQVTGSGLTVPAAPSTLAATRPSTSTRQINLTWTDNSGNESGFKIERATNSTFTTNLVQVATTAANVISYSNSGLAANTRYYYRVRATNAAGNSAYSNVVNALTGA